jgi:hypothetical protein
MEHPRACGQSGACALPATAHTLNTSPWARGLLHTLALALLSSYGNFYLQRPP